MATLLFFDEGHKYTLDGEELPSVTQLVAPLGDDFDEPDDYMEGALDAASDRGTTMHAYIAHRLMGGEPGEFELPSDYFPYAESVEAFLSEHRITPLLIETPLAGFGFAGTPDLICDFDGSTSIMDWKFVSSISKSKVGAQLGGYSELCESNGIFPERLYAVQFLRNEDYRLYPAEMIPCREAFHLCRSVYALKAKKHPRGGIA